MHALQEHNYAIIYTLCSQYAVSNIIPQHLPPPPSPPSSFLSFPHPCSFPHFALPTFPPLAPPHTHTRTHRSFHHPPTQLSITCHPPPPLPPPTLSFISSPSLPTQHTHTQAFLYSLTQLSTTCKCTTKSWVGTWKLTGLLYVGFTRAHPQLCSCINLNKYSRDSALVLVAIHYHIYPLNH